MAFDYVTSKQGKPHVTAAQMGALQAATIGSGRYVLKEYADGLAVSMTDANTLSIAAGALAIDGRYVVNDEPTTVKIANGGQNSYRHDLVVLTIKDDPSTGIGSVGVSVARGAAASSAAAVKDPSVVEGSMLGGNVATCPIARVKLDGLTPTCELMLKSVGSLATLGESVSQAKNALIKAEDAGVAGYAGRISVRHDGFGTSSSPHGFVSDEETFVQVTGFLWTDNEQTGAWPALVKAPWQPDDLKDYWCVKVPVKVAKEGAVNVAHRSHVDADCVLYSEATGGGALAYSGTTTKRLFSSTDGLLYVALHKEKPAGLPAILYVDATIPLVGL